MKSKINDTTIQLMTNTNKYFPELPNMPATLSTWVLVLLPTSQALCCPSIRKSHNNGKFRHYNL